MKQSYDIFNGEFDLLVNDIMMLEQQLIEANQEIVQTLGQMAKDSIVANSFRADEMEQRLAIANETNLLVMNSGSTSLAQINNPNPKATFAEFGYGIVGKNNPYQGNSLFNMSNAGWQGYDLDSKFKRPDRSWWYKGKNTFGSTPKHIFFYTGQSIKDRTFNVARDILIKKVGIK